MSFFKILSLIGLFILFSSCASDDDPDFTFDIVGDYEGQMISSTQGLRFVSCSVTRVGVNEIKVQFTPNTAGAGFEASVTESPNGYFFEIAQQISTDSTRYVRGLNRLAESNDGSLDSSTDILQFGFQVSDTESFTSFVVEEYTGSLAIAETPTNSITN